MTQEKTTCLLIFGAPASGKGTQATMLKDYLGLPHIASGDLFREHLNRNTPLGQQARQYIDRGELVPDDVTTAMVIQRLKKADARRCAIFDGFPRTLPQARALDAELERREQRIDLVLYIRVPDDVLVERVSGRLLCRRCGESYHVKFNPPRVPGVCDKCGGELYQREDDKPETVRTRLAVFRRQTNPLIDYYRARGVLVELDGNQPIEAVQQTLRNAIEARLHLNGQGGEV